ncbi:MAG: DUF1311 domain-containing protein [Deltaproteobacteria bacterium]|jgi:uncharacterized protein YecT (DUF1311 family)|nr:DUF1311 domain-containing protein [Deltaproteobacteria bacterium]
MYKIFIAILAVTFLLNISNNIYAEDNQFTTGIDHCLNNATEYVEFTACYSEAASYWDNFLNENYQKVVDLCNNDNGNGEQCLKILRNAQRSWLAYRDGMIKTIYEIMGNGQVTEMQAAEFLYSSTQDQALILGTLASLP